MALSGLRVMLAEDNPTNQLVASQMLESLGATVTLARDGAEALEIVGREGFDVALIDIEMPRVSGLEVIRTIRAAAGPLGQLPMVALTAYVMREHRAAIESAGADGIIAKPILSIEQFGADIRRFMCRRGARGAGTAEQGVGGAVIDRDIYGALAQAIGPAAMTELLEKVDADVRGARERLARGLGAQDLEAVRAATHVLVSVAGAVGARQVQEGAKRMNAAAHRGEAAAVENGTAGLLAEIDRLLDFVRGERGG
jgi:CheY-like chemotaxis protein